MSYPSAPDITGHPLIRRLTDLGLDADDFVIFGSAPLFVHGLHHTLRDLDIVAQGRAWDRARQSGSPGKGTITGAEAAHFGEEEEISVFQNWISPCWDTHELIGRAEIIGGLRFAPLADVLVYKLMLQRPKDIADIQRILQSDRLGRAESIRPQVRSAVSHASRNTRGTASWLLPHISPGTIAPFGAEDRPDLAYTKKFMRCVTCEHVRRTQIIR